MPEKDSTPINIVCVSCCLCYRVLFWHRYSGNHSHLIHMLKTAHVLTHRIAEHFRMKFVSRTSFSIIVNGLWWFIFGFNPNLLWGHWSFFLVTPGHAHTFSFRWNENWEMRMTWKCSVPGEHQMPFQICLLYLRHTVIRLMSLCEWKNEWKQFGLLNSQKFRATECKPS